MVPRDTTPTAVKLMASGARSICGCYCRCCRRGCCCCYGCCSEIISRIVSKKTKIKSVVAGRTGKNKTGRSAESGMNTSKKERSISYQNICFLHKKKNCFFTPRLIYIRISHVCEHERAHRLRVPRKQDRDIERARIRPSIPGIQVLAWYEYAGELLWRKKSYQGCTAISKLRDTWSRDIRRPRVYKQEIAVVYVSDRLWSTMNVCAISPLDCSCGILLQYCVSIRPV